jgi:voltage-gated potassium channel Kch
VYLLLGLTWAVAYELVALRQPGAFAGTSTEVDASQRWLYYSFVTLTTVGYGDVTPVHPIARSLAVLKALTGQLYPAILLAHLVSLEVQSRGGG